MEFLRTPDPSAAWAVTPRTTNVDSNGSTVTPVGSASAPSNGNSDRSTIKSSFQTLFTPNVAATPQMFGRPGGPSGLTPFINGGVTPNFVTPGIGMLPQSTLLKGDLAVPQSRSVTSPEMLLSSPYLQAAAKEAVRREFMNMPTYITGQVNVSAATGERTVPGGSYTNQPSPQQQLVYTKDGGLVSNTAVSTSPRSKPPAAQSVASPNSEARVPEAQQPSTTVPSTSQHAEPDATKNQDAVATSPGNQRVPQPNPQPGAPGMQQNPALLQQQRSGQQQLPNGQAPRPFYPLPPQHGMYLMPQNGAMMMHPPPGNPVYIHPGTGMMMYAPAGAPGQVMGHPGIMMPMHPAQMAAHRAPIKPETAAERKERIEREKQDLIREFKKKTREAALVRFRQKRRERRFGKLIRYDCRKKLADARPRVKGRFVRIKADSGADTEDNAQVVPSME